MKKLVTIRLGELLGSDIPLKSHNSLYSVYFTGNDTCKGHLNLTTISITTFFFLNQVLMEKKRFMLRINLLAIQNKTKRNSSGEYPWG